MPNENVEERLESELNKLRNLPPQLRDSALLAVSAYVQYIYTTSMGGAGPVALPPHPLVHPLRLMGHSHALVAPTM
jgi:hypothetical protein